ncbi:MAG: NAD(P)/FAD-dependent oxidoreductase, partial [Actinomycetota bacterium]|nr:NAD(P)/FAD-dependent oxidoreductase [Actinomycetota bacterium]
MSDTSTQTAAPERLHAGSFDAVIIGAGVSGMYQLIKLRELGLSVLVLEAGTGVGGTWYWNRYPGARFDSESYSYGYAFDPELQQEWDWSEHFSPQPETLRYLNHVADRYDLRYDIRFESRVRSVHRDDEAGRWRVTTEDDGQFDSRYVITAIGALSAPVMPAIDGVGDFEGEAFHTGTWPHEPVDFTGKRVGVIGTGATAVQLIQEVAKTAAHLTVFQRTANWCAPLHNSEITPDEQADIKSRYPEIIAACNDTFAGFMHDSDQRRALEVSDEERLELYEKLYAEPGFGIWMANFRDVLVDERANATLSEFVA